MRLFCVEKKEKPKKNIIPIFLLLLFAVFFFISFAVVRATPRIEKIVISAARNAASAQIDNAVLKYMEHNGINYGNIVDINYGQNGTINAVTADAAKIDAIIVRMDNDIGDELKEEVTETEIPLSVILGTEMFMGGNRKIKVRYFPINIVDVNVRHEFEAQGINQTLHTIYLDIAVDIEVILPLRNRTESLSTEILLGQTLIVGGVPNTYVER